MKQNRHWAIYDSGHAMESAFIKNLLSGEVPAPFQDLKDKTGAFFSASTLNRFIREEAIHDDYSLTQNRQRSIRTFSSGEQKMALFNHLLSKKPDFLILDNAVDMLDQYANTQLRLRLETLSERMTIIQIFRRKDEILPFIRHILYLQGDSVVVSGPMEAYRDLSKEMEPFSFNGEIPPASVEFEPMGDPLVRFKNVSVEYGGKKILNNICWEIKKGDFWQLTGPNGSGKTTLLTMVTGDNPKAYGQDLLLFGRKKGSGESIWEIKEKIGYVTPAMTVLFNGNHTVKNMVVSGLYDSIGQYRKPSPFEEDLACQWIDLIGLTGLKKAWFADLSEEQQCMVLIARAMIKHPPLLILDEPTHGIGDHSVSVVTALINKIVNESRTTVVYVSHKKERGLVASSIYELIPGKRGSEGSIQ